ncbi:VOC family protein [Rhodococcus sp. NPDC058532]|uniref:VOC family protein n=1 Tax=Rhodococcus sp. NPDC058532 TaxID=3346540 RepID=UPI00364CBBEB
MTRPAIAVDYTVLDCPDPAALAGFYRDVLGWRLTRSEDDWVILQGPGELRLAFQQAHDFTPVDWPAHGIRMHLDLIVDDMDAAERWVLGLGAQLVEGDADHPTFRVYRDPVGHLFCLCRRG